MNKETFISFYETLHEEVSLEAFGTIYDDAVLFKDPFNDVKGISALYRIFQEMYQSLDNPRFIISEYVENQDIAYVKWDFIFRFKNDTTEHRFTGVSRLEMNAEGKIVSHVDFWDAAEHIYEKIPLLGSVLRIAKRKIAGN